MCDYVFQTYRKDKKLKDGLGVFLKLHFELGPLFFAGTKLAVRLYCNFPNRILIVALGLQSYKGP